MIAFHGDPALKARRRAAEAGAVLGLAVLSALGVASVIETLPVWRGVIACGAVIALFAIAAAHWNGSS